MTLDEAKVIVKIMETADGGCPYCALPLIEQFQKAYPELNIMVLVSKELHEEL